MKSKIIQRHFFWELFFYTIVSTTLILGILLYGNLIKHDDYLIQAFEISSNTFLYLSSLIIPYALSYALPFGFVVSLLFCFGRWSSTKQILALRSLGLGIFSWGKPCFILSIIVSIFSLYIFLDLGPRNRAKFDDEKSRIAWVNINNLLKNQDEVIFDLGGNERNPEFKGLSNLSEMEINRISLSVGKVTGQKWSNVRISLYNDDKQLVRIVNSKLVEVVRSSDYSKLILYLNHVDFESPQNDGDEIFVSFEKWEQPLIIDLGKKDIGINLKRLGFGQLINESFSNRLYSDQAKIIINKKFALGCSSFFLCMVLLPLSIGAGRKETMSNLAVGIISSILYFGLISLNEELAYDNNLPYLLWIPNLLCFIIGIFMILRFEFPNK